MSQAAVGVLGYDQIGKRVADAIGRQPDLRLAGVFESEPQRTALIQTIGLPLAVGDMQSWVANCDFVVVCQEGIHVQGVRAVFAPGIKTTSSLFDPGSSPPTGCVRIACADALAFARLLSCLPRAERVFSSCARRAGHATENRSASVDALEPIFDLPDEDADLRESLAPWASDVYVRRTRVPYTQSHLHHIKIDLATPVTRETAVAAWRASRRIRLAAGADGFADTACVQEYDRDRGRRRGDRPEVFVWEETIAAVGNSLFLTADVSPDATPVPEIIDAVRRLVRPDLDPWEVSRLTNESLGLGR